MKQTCAEVREGYGDKPFDIDTPENPGEADENKENDYIGDNDNVNDPPLRVRQSVAERLKVEAESHEHKLSHLPNSPYCEACIMGKMKEKYSRRKTFKREK